MVKKYEMSLEDLDAVQAAHTEGRDANPIWQAIAKKMGFDHDSAQPIPGEPGCFTAIPREAEPVLPLIHVADDHEAESH